MANKPTQAEIVAYCVKYGVSNATAEIELTNQTKIEDIEVKVKTISKKAPKEPKSLD